MSQVRVSAKNPRQGWLVKEAGDLEPPGMVLLCHVCNHWIPIKRMKYRESQAGQVVCGSCCKDYAEGRPQA